jgi:hypothetical protein
MHHPFKNTLVPGKVGLSLAIRLAEKANSTPTGPASASNLEPFIPAVPAGGWINFKFKRRTPPVVGDFGAAQSKIPRPNSREDCIFVPASAREWKLASFPFPARLQNALGTQACLHLGDLHGLRISRVLRWRNLGLVGMQQLMVFIKGVQQRFTAADLRAAILSRR